MKNKSGKTAFGAGSIRLEEQYEREETRLFNDPVIYHLIDRASRFLIQFKTLRNFFNNLSEKIVPGIIGGQICRTKFIDDNVIKLLPESEQLLILGAGLDTRAYRIKELDALQIYEVDLPDIQKIKKQRLKNYMNEFPSNLSFIPIDFNTQKLEDVLSSSSFDFNKPTIVILEGVTQYLNPDSVHELFRILSKLSAGSYIIFTYVLRDVIERKIEDGNKLMDWAEKKNCPFLFGLNTDEIGSFLSNYNIEVLEDAGSEYYKRNYLTRFNRNLRVFNIERIIISKIKNVEAGK